MPRKISDRTLQMLDVATAGGYERGFKDAEAVMKNRLTIEEDKANLEALKAVTGLANAVGQTIEAMCRAMYKGRGM